MHDHVIQRIFAVGLGLQSIVRRLPDEGAANRIRRYIGDLDAPITDIRNTIFSLQHKPYGGKRSLRDDLLVIVDDAADALRFHPQVTMTGPIDGAIPTHFSDDALATLRESLSNVARHAQASRVEVLVTVDEAAKALTVRVDDNGIGIPRPPSREAACATWRSAPRPPGGIPLASAPPEPGTSVTWVVPLAVCRRRPSAHPSGGEEGHWTGDG